MDIRKADLGDLDAVARLYDAIHTAEENGLITTGWRRGIYPARATAEAALARGDLYVGLHQGTLMAAAVLNGTQGDVYPQGRWAHNAPEDQVFVLHTLVIAPDAAGKGHGRAFVAFYEETAIALGRLYLRMDTNARNERARALYARLGYREAGIVPCEFQGIQGVSLVLLEKHLTPREA